MKLKPLNILLLAVAGGVFIYATFFFDTEKPLRHLPTYGNNSVNEKGDTTYHSIPAFSFIDQNGNVVTEKMYDGKVYVADFFFTTCGGICPIMTSEMDRIADTYIDNDQVRFLSHTVDPETDSVPQLKLHADEMGVNYDQWKMVTGDKKELYNIARTGYLLDAHEGDGGAQDFIHTQNFALIDAQKHIRGFYDGTDSTEMNNLIRDIKVLLEEQNYKGEEE